MVIVQSPNEWILRWDQLSAFLAGGISNCPDWQSYFIHKLREYGNGSNLVVFNPRREGDLAKDGSDAFWQINWEAKYLRRASHIIFWFPKETLCPITLYELGRYATLMADHKGPLSKYLTVGVHPEYQRAFDIECQLGLIDQGLVINHSLDDTIQNFAHKMGLKKG